MAKTYQLGRFTRLINWVFGGMTRLGVGASYREVLTVRGRKSGQLRSTPVDVMEMGGDRWLVAAYGPTNWVANARAAGEVILSRGGKKRRYAVTEPEPAEAIPVLRKYMREIRVTRAYFDVTADAADEAIRHELGKHPVFRLVPL